MGRMASIRAATFVRFYDYESYFSCSPVDRSPAEARDASGERPGRFSGQLIGLGRVPGCSAEPETEADPTPWMGLLERERAGSPALDEAWEEASREWARMKEEGRRAPGGIGDHLAVAVICYTLEFPAPPLGPLYLRFNEASRQCYRLPGGPGQCPEFRALRQLLASALRGLREAEGGQVRGVVYRGASRPFWAEVGATVQFGSYTSTSVSRQAAEGFAWGPTGSTMFHIRTAKGASVERLSPFPQEREVLIPPCEAFRVDRVRTSLLASRPRVDLYLTSLDLGSAAFGPSVPWALYLLLPLSALCC
ncbi:ecto-ADP-ribosyltransferase 5-like [Heptranchias perlo]|uniref:ecto-ADP-ribosyltransferase 5-like n=1 Tax=Heptranchias perlo TaxID=212740 RepID=UPI0035598782